MSSNPIAISSDLMAFQSRIAKDANCSHVIEYGGENTNDSLNDLIEKVWRMKNDWNWVRTTGILIIFIPALQRAANKKKSEQNKD